MINKNLKISAIDTAFESVWFESRSHQMAVFRNALLIKNVTYEIQTTGKSRKGGFSALIRKHWTINNNLDQPQIISVNPEESKTLTNKKNNISKYNKQFFLTINDKAKERNVIIH